MRVLVLDDDPFALRLLERQLALLSVECRPCESAPEALEVLDSDSSFDVLLIDLNMPGMDGVEFLRHLARRCFRGGLALVSGEDERVLQTVSRLAQAHQLRVVGALRKPVLPAALRQVLKAAPPLSRLRSARAVPKRYGVAALRAAIAGGQLVNHYQPLIDLASGRVVGVEALVRWQHPDDGLLLPDRFVPVAENGGLGMALRRAVLDAALRDAGRWDRAASDLRLSVNVSMDNLAVLSFPDEISRVVDAAGFARHRLVLEVTETQLHTDRLALLDIATRLRLKRIGLSIDDFGTGYSSLEQLRDVPFDELKLDRGFIRGIAGDPALRTMVEANIRMARRLAIRTVAEGVEDTADLHCVRELGCDLAQGYVIAQSMPAARLPDWLGEWTRRAPTLLAAVPPPDPGGLRMTA